MCSPTLTHFQKLHFCGHLFLFLSPHSLLQTTILTFFHISLPLSLPLFNSFEQAYPFTSNMHFGTINSSLFSLSQLKDVAFIAPVLILCLFDVKNWLKPFIQFLGGLCWAMIECIGGKRNQLSRSLALKISSVSIWVCSLMGLS